MDKEALRVEVAVKRIPDEDPFVSYGILDCI